MKFYKDLTVQLLSKLAYPDYSADVQDKEIYLSFVDDARDLALQTQTALVLAGIKDLQCTLVYALKLESDLKHSHRERYNARSVPAHDSNYCISKL